jgi:uncharacterized protein YndB with AHSA1/START domain
MTITVSTSVHASISKVWDCWNLPEHIKQWCSASDDWHVPDAENDLREGGEFTTTMAARDGSFSFDFNGIYTNITEHQLIEYRLSDGRKVSITFSVINNAVEITETFDAETENSVEMQQAGWQAILDNFKAYAEK